MYTCHVILFPETFLPVSFLYCINCCHSDNHFVYLLQSFNSVSSPLDQLNCLRLCVAPSDTFVDTCVICKWQGAAIASNGKQIPRYKERECCVFKNVFNRLSVRQNGCHFADNIFKFIFLYENCYISYRSFTDICFQSPTKKYLTLVQKWHDDEQVTRHYLTQ